MKRVKFLFQLFLLVASIIFMVVLSEPSVKLPILDSDHGRTRMLVFILNIGFILFCGLWMSNRLNAVPVQGLKNVPSIGEWWSGLSRSGKAAFFGLHIFMIALGAVLIKYFPSRPSFNLIWQLLYLALNFLHTAFFCKKEFPGTSAK